jgi:hypothetical protein
MFGLMYCSTEAHHICTVCTNTYIVPFEYPLFLVSNCPLFSRLAVRFDLTVFADQSPLRERGEGYTLVSVFHWVSSCGNTESVREEGPYWTSRENSLELIELSSINKVRRHISITISRILKAHSHSKSGGSI